MKHGLHRYGTVTCHRECRCEAEISKRRKQRYGKMFYPILCTTISSPSSQEVLWITMRSGDMYIPGGMRLLGLVEGVRINSLDEEIPLVQQQMRRLKDYPRTNDALERALELVFEEFETAYQNAWNDPECYESGSEPTCLLPTRVWEIDGQRFVLAFRKDEAIAALG